MADYKTAEQYVVEKCETLERELDNAELAHKAEVASLNDELTRTRNELAVAYEILNVIRDRLEVRPDTYWGGVIDFDTLYRKHNPQVFDAILNYFDIYFDNEEDEEDE